MKIRALVIVWAVLMIGLYGNSFELSGHKWSTNTIRYLVNPTGSSLPPATALAAIQSSAAQWNAASKAQLTYQGAITGGTLANDQKNNVFFRLDAGAGYAGYTYYWWDGTGALVDADMILNLDYPWFVGGSGCNSGLYVENTAVHEMGHMLGLSHSAVPTAVMRTTTSLCAYVTTLDPDDVAGIRTLYGFTSVTQTPMALKNLRPLVR